MKTIFGVLAFILAHSAYSITFATFYDSWFPYYYEKSLSTFYLSGTILLLLIPTAWALLLKYKSQISHKKFLSNFYYAVTRFSIGVFLVCIFIFIYMLSNGIYFKGSDKANTYHFEAVK